MIYLFGLSVAFFLFALILLKKDKTRPDYILLSWMGVIALHLLLFFIHYNGLVYEYPHLLGVALPLPILHGVFLYFYTMELIGKEPSGVKPILLHFLPFLILMVMAIPFFLLPADEKVEVFRNEGRGYEWYTQIQTVAFLVAGFGYSIVSIRAIRKHRRRMLENLSNVDRKMLRWLEYLAAGLAIIWLLSAFFNDQVVFGGVVLFVLFIGFFGIHQVPVFYSMPTPDHRPEISSDKPAEPPEDDAAKYARSRLDDQEASRLMTLLETVMITDKPFRNANLTLNDLASALGVSPNDLSQVINSLGGKTFYHYINTYRIREFLKLVTLPGSRKFTYLGLAYQCGFTSKTTFNKYFKLETGQTPSSYLGAEAEQAEAVKTE